MIDLNKLYSLENVMLEKLKDYKQTNLQESLEEKIKTYREFVVSANNYYEKRCLVYTEIFSDEYKKKLDELAKQGFFLYYYEKEINEIVNNEIDDNLLKRLSMALISEMNYTENMLSDIERDKIQDMYYQTLKAFNQNMYDLSAMGFFSIIEYYINSFKGLAKDSTKRFSKEKVLKCLFSNWNKEFMHIWVNIISWYDNAYKKVDKQETGELNRNDLMHGYFNNKTTMQNCCGLYTLCKELMLLLPYLTILETNEYDRRFLENLKSLIEHDNKK